MSAPDTSITVPYAAVSDIGMRRHMNQDTQAVVLADEATWTRHGHLFVVADGMGAHAAGELASQEAVHQVVNCYLNSSRDEPPEALAEAVRSANAEIHRRGTEDTELYNMGTTCSALALLPEGAIVAHVGDSRVYHCREGLISQLTFDHSLLWEMRAAGQLSGDDFRSAVVPRNVITRCLGPQSEVKIDLEGPFPARVGDVFLLCSDGLTGRVSDEEIGAIAGELDPETAARFLVDLANLRGGSDNITVVVVKVSTEAAATPRDRELTWNVPVRTAEPAKPRPAWWGVTAVAVVLALVLQFLGQSVAAFAAIAVALVAGVGILMQWSRKRPRPQPRYGDAPYNQASCQLDRGFVAGVARTLHEVLDDLALSADDDADLRGQLEELQQLARGQDPSVGRRLAVVAHRVLDALRAELQSTSSDSSVELL